MATERWNVPVLGQFRPGWLIGPGIFLGALGVLVVALLVGGGRPEPAPPGLPEPGMVTGWGLPVAKLVMDLAAVGTVGSLLFALLAPSRGALLDAGPQRAVRAASAWAWLWAAAATSSLLLTLSDLLGIPLLRIDYQDTLAGFIAEVTQGRALAVVVLLSVIVAASSRGVRTLNGAALLLILAVAAALPPVLTGHSASSANHDVATSSLLVHVVAVTIWVGGLVALVVYGRSSAGSGNGLARTAARFSTVAIWCFAAAAFSGVVNAWVRLSGVGQLFTTEYGWLLLGKIAALCALGGVGWWHRRATLPALSRGAPRAFWRFAVGEAAVMAATIGLAVALALTPPPTDIDLSPQSTATALIGYPVPPVSAMRLLTEWRVDALVLVLATAGVVCYLRGVMRLRARDIAWPVGRTIAWLAGVAVAVVVMCGGVATYAPAMFSVHMVQHMTLTMLVPILLAMGAPITLALRALPAGRRSGEAKEADRGLRGWILVVLHSRVASVLTHPVVAFGLYIVSLYAFYFSGLFAASMRSHVGHLLMAGHFLAVGALFFWSVIGLDPMPRQLPAFGRMIMVFASLPFHAFFGVVVMTSTTLIGGEWFAALKLPWIDPLVDQNLGGGIAWASGELPTLLVLGVVFVQWVRADTREARRFDRRMDAGTDDQLAAYNAWLADLAERGRRRPEPR